MLICIGKAMTQHICMCVCICVCLFVYVRGLNMSIHGFFIKPSFWWSAQNCRTSRVCNFLPVILLEWCLLTLRLFHTSQSFHLGVLVFGKLHRWLLISDTLSMWKWHDKIFISERIERDATKKINGAWICFMNVLSFVITRTLSIYQLLLILMFNSQFYIITYLLFI